MGRKSDLAYQYSLIQNLTDRVHQLTLRIDNIVAERNRRFLEQLEEMSNLRKEFIGMIDDLYETMNLKDEMDSLSKLIVEAGQEVDLSAEYYDYLQEDYDFLNELRFEKARKLNTVLEGNK